MGKYYSEEKMRKYREKLEETVLTWSGSSQKKMFGCPCYLAGGPRTIISCIFH